MPRSPDGTYTPPNPDVAPGEVISSGWANSTIADISQALTESLSREGEGGMLTPLPFGDGTEAAPGITWNSETASGFYRAGAGDMRVSILGQDIFRWLQNVAQVWDDTQGIWLNVLDAQSPNTVPNGTVDKQALVWNDGTQLWDATNIASVDTTYDPNLNLVITATDVQNALVEVDNVLAQFNTHAADQSIHWLDVPNDGTTYNRRDGAWVESVAGISDHSALNGLAIGDDHPQYLNDARADAAYLAIGATAVDATLWNGQTQVITETDPGIYNPNTIYFIVEPTV